LEVDAVGAYMTLLRQFLCGSISASEFERRYLDAFKNDTAEYTETVYQVLDELFGDVDAYCADPALRGPGDFDELQLRSEAGTALLELEQLAAMG
jgi:Bacterial self-protective colicin-like immunity